MPLPMGISKFIVSDHGIFLNECAVNQDYIRFSIQVAPNPANSYTIVKFKNKLQVDNNFTLSLFGSNGQLINKFPTNQIQLMQGYRLITSEFNDGVYFIQISSDKINQIFRLIRYNYLGMTRRKKRVGLSAIFSINKNYG